MEACALTCLGVGDGTANADRNHSAYLYQFGPVCLLVDAGEPVSRSYQATGLGCERVDRILLSHWHSDHFAGLFMLLQGWWLEQRRKPLHIHAPPDGIEPMRQMLVTANLVEEVLPFPVRFEPWETGQALILGKVRVTAYPTSHLEGLRRQLQDKYPGQYAAYCFLFQVEGRRIAHSADLGTPEDLAPLLLHPLDLLVCELCHVRIAELCTYLHDRPIKKIVFTHLAREYWEDFERTRQQVHALLTRVPVSYAWDGDEIEF